LSDAQADNGGYPVRRAPSILFIPVSGKYGMGEYARSAAIARAVTARWSSAAVHFILSRQAPYAADAPYPATLLASSPTFHTAAVVRVLEQLRPDVVVFDNAGRTAQLRAAKRLGARVIYISARQRQRGKAFRWRWMRLLDEHWIAYPEFIAGRLGWIESLKLKILGRPRVRYLDVILSQPEPAECAAILLRLGCAAGAYVLVIPGGGTGHPGAGDATAQFLAAARSLAAAGVPTAFVGPADIADTAETAEGAPGDTAAKPKLRALGPLPQRDLAVLMRFAKLIVANGGSTLLQGIACANACVAVPIAKDQIERIRRCVSAEVALAARLDSADIVRIAQDLLRDEAARTELARRAQRLALADGIAVALQALERLLDPLVAQGE